VHSINELTVVTDESYTAFVEGLQRELGESPERRPPLPVDGRKAKWAPHRRADIGQLVAGRHVELDSSDLIGRCVIALNDHLNVEALRYVVEKGEQRAAGTPARTGFTAAERSTLTGTGAARSQVTYDLIGEIAGKTRLTRRTVTSILRQINPAAFASYRQNPGQFISESARLINAQAALVLRSRSSRLAD